MEDFPTLKALRPGNSKLAQFGPFPIRQLIGWSPPVSANLRNTFGVGDSFGFKLGVVPTPS